MPERANSDEYLTKRRGGGCNGTRGTLCLAGNLLKHPVDITDNQVEVGEVHTWSERIGPPTEAQYHQERAVGPAVVEVVERKVIREGVVDRRPILAVGWLDC